MLAKPSCQISLTHLRGKELLENKLWVGFLFVFFKILGRLTAESMYKLKSETTWNQTALELVQAMDCSLATITDDHNTKPK